MAFQSQFGHIGKAIFSCQGVFGKRFSRILTIKFVDVIWSRGQNINSQEIHHGNQFKKIFQHAPWYFLISVLTKLTSFLLMPVYTRYLSPYDYGVLNTLFSYSNILPLFISLSLDSSFSRYYFHEKVISEQNVKELYSTLFWFIAIWGGGITGLTLMVSPYLVKPLLNLPYWPYIPLTILPMLFSQLGVMGGIYLRSTLRTRQFATLNIVSFFVSTSVTLTLLVLFRLGVRASLYGSFIRVCLTLVAYLFLSVRYSLLGWYFNIAQLKRCLRFSLPLLPAVAGSWISGLSDRLILAYYGRVLEVGLYSISATIARIIYFVNDGITQVQMPISMSALTENRESGKQQISEFLSFFIWVITFAFLGLTFFCKEMLYLFADQRYHSAYKLVGVLAFTFVLGGIYRPFTVILSFHRKTWLLTGASIVSSLVNAILNFIFIPFWGQWAAAWSTLLSMLAYTIWIIFWAQKLDPIPVNYRMIKALFLWGGSLLALQQFGEFIIISLYANFILKICLIGIFIAICFTSQSFFEVKSHLTQVVSKIYEIKNMPG